MSRLSDREFVDLLERHRDEFYRYVHHNVWNPDTAEDVMSAAVLAAYRQLDKFEKGTNFRAWMFRILTNKCYVANRETKRSAIDIESVDESMFAIDPDGLAAASKDPEQFVAACGDELSSALRQLSTAERSCLLLLTVDHYSYKEIASILEIPLGTVMTHLSRGRAKLRRLLVDHARREGIISTQRHRELTDRERSRRAS